MHRKQEIKLRAKCFSVPEILLVLREKVSVHPYALKVGPGRRDGDRNGVEVVYLRIPEGEQERGVGGDYELAAVTSCQSSMKYFSRIWLPGERLFSGSSRR